MTWHNLVPVGAIIVSMLFGIVSWEMSKLLWNMITREPAYEKHKCPDCLNRRDDKHDI